MVKPNFFILGAAKAGTTALAQILMQHPEAFIPKDKELNFLLACEAESYLALNGFKKITDFTNHSDFNPNRIYDYNLCGHKTVD